MKEGLRTMILEATISLVLIGASGCVSDYHPIADGTYSMSSGEERIVVRQSEMHFVIRIDRDGQKKILDRTYGYTVLPDGRIQPHPVRSADAVFGVGSFDWYWDGTRIIQKDPKSNEPINSFARRP